MKSYLIHINVKIINLINTLDFITKLIIASNSEQIGLLYTHLCICVFLYHDNIILQPCSVGVIGHYFFNVHEPVGQIKVLNTGIVSVIQNKKWHQSVLQNVE